LKAALQVDVLNKVEMTEAVAELNNGDFLLHDPARAFLQSGNLVKKSGRTGRSTMYRFFLFSDVLLYASKVANGRYKIHEELPLHLMKIVDWFPPSQKNRTIMFEVHHPRKTFQVLCPSNNTRKSWVENIRASILVEMERNMTIEAARLSVRTAGNKLTIKILEWDLICNHGLLIIHRSTVWLRWSILYTVPVVYKIFPYRDRFSFCGSTD
jgi:hypothetical protein